MAKQILQKIFPKSNHINALFVSLNIFCIFKDYFNILTRFCEKITLPVCRLHRSHGATFGHFRTFPIITNICL